MSESDMKERQQNTVVITEVPLPALQRLVEFLYTGVLEEEKKGKTLQEVYDLYYAADKYEVMDLLSMCAEILMHGCTVDNASQILVWADRHDDKDMREKAMNFIISNFETVVDADSWDHFVDSETKLAAKVVGSCAKKLKAKSN